MAHCFLQHQAITEAIMINSPSPSATYKHKWNRPALVQIMNCCLFGTKPLSKQMIGCCQLDKMEKPFHSQKNASEYTICEMAAISSRWRLIIIDKYLYVRTTEIYFGWCLPINIIWNLLTILQSFLFNEALWLVNDIPRQTSVHRLLLMCCVLG